MGYLRRVEMQKDRNRRHEERRRRRQRRLRERMVARSTATELRDGVVLQRHGVTTVPLRDENGKEYRARVTVCANCLHVLDGIALENGGTLYVGHVAGTCAPATDPEPALRLEPGPPETPPLPEDGPPAQ